jgi:hypothetical protein
MSREDLKTLLELAFEAGLQLGNDIEMNNSLTDFEDWYRVNINE